jgi:signal transduction histidine kinase
VSDRGPGVDPAVADRVFSRFARGNASGGLGLGLYLAHEIARAHGGTLQFAAARGGGTVFTLTLPAAPSRTVSPAAPRPQSPPPP